MSSITLHPTRGLNPRLTACVYCGKSVGVALLGLHDKIRKCDRCGGHTVGAKFGATCPACDGRGRLREVVGRLGEHDKVPDVCDGCRAKLKAERAEQAAVVAEGGIYFQCDCGAGGTICATAPIAAEVRRELRVDPPKPCGVVLSNRPACRPPE